MNNYLIFGILLLTSMVTQARPQVGDFAIYDAEYSSSIMPAPSFTTAASKILAYDSKTKEYSLSLQFGAADPVFYKQTLFQLEPRSSATAFRNCIALNGTYETVVVPYGRYRACRLNDPLNPGSTNWVAREVPVSVKIIFEDTTAEIKATMNLRSFGVGR